MNFAERVENIPDSPERGFELALYYAVTGDEQRGLEAVRWASAHACEKRQVALIRDWCNALFKRVETGTSCEQTRGGSLSDLRDQFLLKAANGEDTEADVERDKGVLLDKLKSGNLGELGEVYAAFEYLSAARTVERTDLREEDPHFYTSLPIELLLNLKPREVEHPNWRTHVAALALVSLDPNLDSSQFLQAWAIEDRQTIREGPGVGYEFLWADPYLPGVGYQNLDPWLYDDSRAMLVARTNWTTGACWIRITPGKIEDENCPADWQTKPLILGRMTLLPKIENCVKFPRRAGNESLIVWRVPPKTKLSYVDNKVVETTTVDASGMWRVPSNAGTQACTPPPSQADPPDKLKNPK